MTLLVVDVSLCGCMVFHLMNILQCMHSIGGHFISMKFLSLSFGRQMYSFIWVRELQDHRADMSLAERESIHL